MEDNENNYPEVEFTSPNAVWHEDNNIYRLRDRAEYYNKLEPAVYVLDVDLFGFYLEKKEKEFTFDHKIYGLSRPLIDRVIKSYSKLEGNLGVLLNGTKGTGKTVTAKIMCNELRLPVILVPKHINNSQFFINGISQDLIVFIDEYEKIYKGEESAEMLTIMDGAMNSVHRRVFILTTNQLYINDNLIQRPGRIRYLQTFKDLASHVIEEIVDDKLLYKEFKKEVIKFVSGLEIITVDVISSIIEEVNIHREGPASFKEVFNVKQLTGKYDVIHLSETGEMIKKLYSNAQIYPNVNRLDSEDIIGHMLTAGGQNVGMITEIMSRNIVKIKPEPGRKPRAKKGDKTEKIKIEPLREMIIELRDADIVNQRYKSSAWEHAHMM